MKYKVYIRNIACQTRYIPPQPHIIPALIGAGVAIASSIAAASQNSKNFEEQRAINRENQQFQREMFRTKSLREDALNANSALIQRQSLEKAGLNPNIGSYGQLQTNVSQGSASSQAYSGQNPLAGIDPGALASMIQNEPLVKSQAELTEQKAKEQEILNRRMENEDRTHEVLDTISQYIEESKINPNIGMPDVPVLRHDAGWFKAMREQNQYRGEKQTVDIQGFENSLRQLIIEKQMARPDVLSTFVEMPIAEKTKLIQEAHLAVANAQLAQQKKSESEAQTKYINTQDAYMNLKKQIESDNNLTQYVHKMFAGDFGFEDAVKMLVLVAVMQMSK